MNELITTGKYKVLYIKYHKLQIDYTFTISLL